jgi:DNA polymerase-3 subunit beta
MNAHTKVETAGARIARAELLAALRLAAMVAPRRAAVPILSHVLMTGAGQITSIRASDLDVEFLAHVDGPVWGDFAATAHAGDLMRVVASLPADDVALALLPDRVLSVAHGRAAAKLWGVGEDDFPAPLAGETPHVMKLPAEALAGILRRVAPAVSREETRYYLNGVNLSLAPDAGGALELTAVATDGHRMHAVGTLAPDGATMPEGSVIVPARAVAVMLALLARERGVATLSVGDRLVRLTTPAGQVTAKTIDGTYPDWRRVIPEWDASMVAEVRREHVARVLRRFAAVDGRPNGDFRALRFDRGADGFTVSARRPGDIELADHLPANGCGAWPAFGLNSRYLAAVVAQTSGDLSLSASAPYQPVVIRDAADPRAVFCIMPMRV